MVGFLRLNMQQAFSCVILLLIIQIACAKKNDDKSHEQNNNFQRSNSSEKNDVNPTGAQTIDRRQDEGGFDFMKYFIGRGQDEEEEPAQQQLHQVQQPLSIRQQHQLQQQILKEQQRRQQEQLLQLQQQQLGTLQQQQPAVAYQVPQSRDGGYGGGISIGNGYAGGAAQPKDIAISIGGGKPILQIGNILRVLPRIINVLSAGGKVMFGVELGNNFYFGPVGAKPLAKAG